MMSFDRLGSARIETTNVEAYRPGPMIVDDANSVDRMDHKAHFDRKLTSFVRCKLCSSLNEIASDEDQLNIRPQKTCPANYTVRPQKELMYFNTVKISF